MRVRTHLLTLLGRACFQVKICFLFSELLGSYQIFPKKEKRKNTSTNKQTPYRPAPEGVLPSQQLLTCITLIDIKDNRLYFHGTPFFLYVLPGETCDDVCSNLSTFFVETSAADAAR